jgi:hypothetical protein
LEVKHHQAKDEEGSYDRGTKQGTTETIEGKRNPGGYLRVVSLSGHCLGFSFL